MRMLSREDLRLRRDFFKGQKYTLHDLHAEISANHFATAHRLVHTLKGLAGMINEHQLADISRTIEGQLRSKNPPVQEDMSELENELNRVLTEITESGVMDDETWDSPPSVEEQITLFNKLHHYLVENDAACMELLPQISQIPETKVLVRQVENFAFEPALVTLAVLREVLGV